MADEYWFESGILGEKVKAMGRKKKENMPARDHLQRHKTHVIDEKARRHFTNSLPPEWVSNPMNGDYGKDYHVEVTGEGGRVSRAFYVQLKGTGRCKFINGGNAVSFSLEKKYLSHYLVQHQVPGFAIRSGGLL